MPYLPVGKIEEHGQARSAGRMDALDCVYISNVLPRDLSLPFAKCASNERAESAHRATRLA
jgi:hypothetical protein